MHVLLRATLVALLLGASVSASTWADNVAATGCGSAAKQTEAEGGGVGSQNLVTHKTESEGGGVGSANLKTRKTGAATADQPTNMAATAPCP
jgi:hypothetical protein